MLSVHTILINSGNSQKRIIYYYIYLTRNYCYQINHDIYSHTHLFNY